MYRLTNEKDPFYVHYECECGRKYRAEELYICYSCNKILCSYCLVEEINSCYCKNYCKRNISVSVNQAKRMKNSCDQCLECPSCQTSLVKKVVEGKHILVCPYCFWDSTAIKFKTSKESELDNLISQLKEQSNKGYLKKMFDILVNKYKENEILNDTNSIQRTSFNFSNLRTSMEVSMDVNKALEAKEWGLSDIDHKLSEEEKFSQERLNFRIEDSYIADKNCYAFPTVVNFLACNLDYTNKDLAKVETIDKLKDKLKNEFDISLLSGYDKRMHYVISQHPNPSIIFPQFIELLPKKSKRCKICKKFIVQIEETKAKSQKPELCHLFLNQFPYIYINKVDTVESRINLKFVIFDFKETKLRFEESEDSPTKIILPTGCYDVSDRLNSEVSNTQNNEDNKEFIILKGDRVLILLFKYVLDETNRNNEFIIIRFMVKAEYVRLEPKKISYKVEAKIKIK